MNTTVRKTLATLLIASTASFSMPAPAQADGNARSEARAGLVKHGVDPAHANQRVAALTDVEAAELAAHIDQLPAGGFVDPFTGAMVLVMGAAVVVALLPFIVIGSIVALAVKNRGTGNGEVASTEDQGPR